MAFKFDDFSDSSSTSKAAVRIACPLGDKCDHADVEECDAYRQHLLEVEHKKTCKNCQHFDEPARGFPPHALYKGLSPAEYLLKSRGINVPVVEGNSPKSSN